MVHSASLHEDNL